MGLTLDSPTERASTPQRHTQKESGFRHRQPRSRSRYTSERNVQAPAVLVPRYKRFMGRGSRSRRAGWGVALRARKRISAVLPRPKARADCTIACPQSTRTYSHEARPSRALHIFSHPPRALEARARPLSDQRRLWGHRQLGRWSEREPRIARPRAQPAACMPVALVYATRPPVE